MRRSRPSRPSDVGASRRPSLKKHTPPPAGSEMVVCRRPVGRWQPIGAEEQIVTGSGVSKPIAIGGG